MKRSLIILAACASCLLSVMALGAPGAMETVESPSSRHALIQLSAGPVFGQYGTGTATNLGVNFRVVDHLYLGVEGGLSWLKQRNSRNFFFDDLAGAVHLLGTISYRFELSDTFTPFVALSGGGVIDPIGGWVALARGGCDVWFNKTIGLTAEVGMGYYGWSGIPISFVVIPTAGLKFSL